MIRERSTVTEGILDYIYPRRCPACRNIINPRGKLICDDCSDSFSYVREPRCYRCSKTVESEEQEYCFDCIKRKHTYKRGYAVFEYDKLMKQSMSDFKFHGWADNGDYYAETAARLYGDRILAFAPDALVPVPVHKSKLRKRGYNQAEILAMGIGRRLNIEVKADLLLRQKKTLPQKLLNDTERMKNLSNAFLCKAESFSNRKFSKIMLVDDIYTTGSTIEACTRALMDAGVNEVEFVSICIGKGD